MKPWIKQRCFTLHARPWAGFAKHRIQHSSVIFLLWDHGQNTTQTSEHADRHNDHTLAKQEGKCCHSVRVLKNTVQEWHRFTRYAALKELSSFHIKIQISCGPACRFYLLSDVWDFAELIPQTIADKTSCISFAHFIPSFGTLSTSRSVKNISKLFLKYNTKIWFF